MLTGTDEHGMKIQAAAKAAKKKPQQFCDEISTVFRDLPDRANVQYDKFIRTTDSAHKESVTHFWNVLVNKGFIYKASHKGWYSVSDETFFPESAVEEQTDTLTGLAQKVSIETGNVVTWTEEENYHFRLSAMRDRLLQFYRENPAFIVPQSRYIEVIAAVESGLQDLSISRPRSRLTWGIPVPDDSSQTIYVWLDALVNYLSAAGYPGSPDLWPADLHVIGKDIVRFHCIFWPAFLMAADLEPPKQVLAHSHWTMANYKMSKSRGNVVDPWYALDRFGRDPVRYYLMRDGRLDSDGNYSTEHLMLRHNHELANNLGNLVARAASKTFDVHGILASRPQINGKAAKSLIAHLSQSTDLYFENMQNHHVYKAIANVMDIISAANNLLQAEEPWLKTCTEEVRSTTIYLAIESARIATLLLSPIMPESCASILDRLGVPTSARTKDYARLGSDIAYQPSSDKAPHIFSVLDMSVRPGTPAKRAIRELRRMNDKLA